MALIGYKVNLKRNSLFDPICARQPESLGRCPEGQLVCPPSSLKTPEASENGLLSACVSAVDTVTQALAVGPRELRANDRSKGLADADELIVALEPSYEVLGVSYATNLRLCLRLICDKRNRNKEVLRAQPSISIKTQLKS